jgi:hypothetical protein
VAVTRRTFVVQVNEDDLVATVEDVRTQRRVRLATISELPVQIRAWLRTSERVETRIRGK